MILNLPIITIVVILVITLLSLIWIFKKLNISKLIVIAIAFLYLFSIILSSVFIKNSDIGTIINPIVFYVIVNIILRNNPEGNDIKRLSDINDMALVSYGLSYLFLKHLYNNHKKELYRLMYYNKEERNNDVFSLNLFNIHLFNINEPAFKILVTSILLIAIMILLLILILSFSTVSKFLNKKSHWNTDQNNIEVNTSIDANSDNKFKLIYSKNKTVYNAKGNIKTEVTKNKYKKED